MAKHNVSLLGSSFEICSSSKVKSIAYLKGGEKAALDGQVVSLQDRVVYGKRGQVQLRRVDVTLRIPDKLLTLAENLGCVKPRLNFQERPGLTLMKADRLLCHSKARTKYLFLL